MHEIIRRGDYFEIQIAEREATVEPKKKAEEPNVNICTDDVSQQEALARFSLPPKLPPTDDRITGLREQLRLIEKELAKDPKADPNEVRETKELLVELATLENLSPVKVNIQPFKKELAAKAQDSKTMEYKLMLPVSTSLENRLRHLQQLDYLRLTKLQQLTSILVGEHFANEEKLARSKNLQKLESKAALFNRYQKLETTIEEFPQLVERINGTESVHCEIAHTVEQFRRVTTLHHEMLEEFGEDSALTTKLAANFDENKKKLTATISSFKERLAKLKKK